ncbi:phage replisome organizer N-terminal domain-containing protein [Jeotgalibaca sp. MA1X17-3]|uniref:phage replisome organizer N-terminal domain-containing protein n=1 Tax=Jeotgalibaca sp. MA1X17-3 TaxID=2908211 RepID=UPI001F46A0A3|nr:phage replisome organizer N-terminal domain-containing protein [Jeotgalibaca sp. MA1X17-3]UJF15088.1 phage replisome organizer N-terminal domain-containing protein [Jeotgalibaca sp. MA1X17-3]
MSENKKYYWLKLNDNFFEDDTVTWLEEQENGKDYIIFYLKLCLKSLQNDGSLIRYVGEKLIPYDIKALANLTDTKIDTVAVAMKTFEEIGLVSRLESGEIYLNQINEMIGSETDSAKRMRKIRAKQNALPSHCANNVIECDIDVQKSDTEIEIEIEKEIEIDSPDLAKAKYDDNSPYLRASRYLFKMIKQNNSKAKPPNYQRWADDIRKLVELDKNTLKEVSLVIDWSQQDPFWKKNILSASKLREQFPKLWANGNFEEQASMQKEEQSPERIALKQLSDKRMAEMEDVDDTDFF